MSESKTHALKTWPDFFERILDGTKTFEVRKEDDRRFSVGDTLLLQEWLPGSKRYTGRELAREVTYILAGPSFGVERGCVVMGIRAPPPAAADVEAADFTFTTGNVPKAIYWAERGQNARTFEEAREACWKINNYLHSTHLGGSALPPRAPADAALSEAVRWLEQGCATVSLVDKDVALHKALAALRGAAGGGP